MGKSKNKQIKSETVASRYQIDQSGKIEQTERNTVIACINGKQFTILLKKREKRKIQRVFKAANMQRLFPYVTFATLIAILLHKLSPKHKVIIDKEYFGHEDFIEERIETFVNQLGSKIPPISFGHVGKLSKAHQLGYKVAIGKEQATLIVNADKVLKVIFGTKNRANDRLTQE